MKRLLSTLAVSAVLLGGLSACDTNVPQQQADPQYARVCVDQNHNRVPADECAQQSNSGVDTFLWYYVLFGSRLPYYGQPVYHGYTHISHTSVYVRAERAPAGKSYSSSTSKYRAPVVRPVASAPKAKTSTSHNYNYKAPKSVYRAPKTSSGGLFGGSRSSGSRSSSGGSRRR